MADKKEDYSSESAAVNQAASKKGSRAVGTEAAYARTVAGGKSLLKPWKNAKSHNVEPFTHLGNRNYN